MLVITCIIIVLYLLYPVWLITLSHGQYNEEQSANSNNVSIIYLSRNGACTLLEKINFLLNEIADIDNSELIVIDDGSNDKSVEKLKGLKHHRIHLILKQVTTGIPHSMNLGVRTAKYENIVFCDQRQRLEKGIIKKLLHPLKYTEIGAVSSCVSRFDKTHKFSLIRAHENFIKQHEGRTGNLIGVYGPLYSIKKQCYRDIPDGIILDDLYLTLNILRTKQVVFLKDCEIFDDCLESIYNFNRTRRYLAGFFQILQQKDLICQLSGRHMIMLIWHKYLRLFIPLLLLCSYVILLIKSSQHISYLIAFISISLLSLFFLIPTNNSFCRQIKSLIQFVSYYFFATINLIFTGFILNQKIYSEKVSEK